MDNLENHIRNTRSELDRYEPSHEVWTRVRKKIRKTGRTVYLWLSIAAMLVVVLGTALTLFTINRQKGANYRAINKTEPALKETEIYYNTMIRSLYSEAVPLMTRHPVIEKELNSGMAKLDSIYADIRKDLKDNVANQEVIEALIQNYRTKIQLLEEMLNLLKENENKQEKTKSHEL
jgi:hypothetical protein